MQQDIDIIEQLWQTLDKLVADSYEMQSAHQKMGKVIDLLNLWIVHQCI